MVEKIKADNDTWRATLEPPGPGGSLTMVFFCASNGQRPYRVVRLEPDELPEGGFGSLSADGLRALFERSESMNVSPS